MTNSSIAVNAIQLITHLMIEEFAHFVKNTHFVTNVIGWFNAVNKANFIFND